MSDYSSYETKAQQVDITAEADGIITAYAATFDDIDSYGDAIAKGAFAETLKERKDKIKVLYNHDAWQLPIGTPILIEEDSTGLLTQTKMSATQIGQDVYTLAKEGALDSLSIGFRTIEVEYLKEEDVRKTGVWRILKKLALYEYSIVPFPANELAVITSVKSGGELEREIRRWTKIYEMRLKSNELSQCAARRIVEALTELKGMIEHVKEEKEERNKLGDAHTLLATLKGEAKRLGDYGVLQELRSFEKSLRSEYE